MNTVQTKGAVTVIMWITYLGFIWMTLPTLGVWVSILAFVLMIPLVFVMGGLWGLFDQGETNHITETQSEINTEKRKRERLDAVLRDLSDDDLLLLRQRLQDGTVDDDLLYEQIVGDDGEFLQQRQ